MTILGTNELLGAFRERVVAEANRQTPSKVQGDRKNRGWFKVGEWGYDIDGRATRVTPNPLISRTVSLREIKELGKSLTNNRGLTKPID
ncbi:hypothetical protein [Asticcacaulis solisilvae]|uniref:hypothetical protein n=1 Tax=Asticcacaulis solisilvae TaxID=1217274 RepID=UPI003FD6D256